MGSDLFAPCEVAQHLKLSYKTVLKLIHKGELEAIRVERGYRVSESSIEAFKRRNVYQPLRN